MNIQSSKAAGLKRKAVHEAEVFVGISLYLAFFFCSIVTYRMTVQRDFRDWHVSYISALITALVIAKVILIGEYAHVGKRSEGKPLLVSAIYKAFLFSLLVFGFHIVEEVIKGLIRGRSLAEAFYDIHIHIMLGAVLVVFSTFVPFFAFRELRRILGEDTFRGLFFRKGTVTISGPISKSANEP